MNQIEIEQPTIGDESEINDNRAKKLKKILNDLPRTKRQVNKVLYQISRTKYDSIPLSDIFNTLKRNGLIVLQEDNTEWCGLLCGSNEQVYFDVAWESSEYESDGCKFYIPIKAKLSLSWYKYETGRYEITTYLG